MKASSSRGAARPGPRVADPPILVTGASGNVGSEAARILRAQGFQTRAPSRAEFDFDRPETFSDTFRGVERMFLMRPPAISDPGRLRPALESARESGVRHVVFLSLLGVERNPVVPHGKIEKLIQSMGFEHTFLRPSFFMQNLSTTHAADIREGREILVPAGSGRTSFVDARDVAAAAAKALTEPGHANKSYSLTGSEALAYGDVARILSEELEIEIRYRNPSIFRFARAMRARNYPWAFIGVMIGIYTVARVGLAGRVTSELGELLGREPVSFRRFAHDYRAAWI